jgi:hypothetical protein
MSRLLLSIAALLSCLVLDAQTRISTKAINDDVLFSPEFHSYSFGRKTNDRGEGETWYKRFSVLHMSDIHTSPGQLREALEVAGDRMDVVINCGDDANGCTLKDRDDVLKALKMTGKTVRRYNSCAYVQAPGNHDVTGITKHEYFSRVCSLVSLYSENVVWGNPEQYRTYGYMDFVDGKHMGDFRIIMLDPFDYNDGEFPEPYEFISAVFSQKQIDWFIDALVDAASKNLHVITVMHYSFGDNTVFSTVCAKPDATFHQDPFMIPDIIDAIQNKRTLTATYPDDCGKNDIRIERDFTDVSDLDYVAHLFGHIHSKNAYRCQKTDGSKKYDILMLGEASLALRGTAVNEVAITPGTINDIAFSALQIDVLEKAIYRVSYGAYLKYDGSPSPRTEKIPYRYE